MFDIIDGSRIRDIGRDISDGIDANICGNIGSDIDATASTIVRLVRHSHKTAHDYDLLRIDCNRVGIRTMACGSRHQLSVSLTSFKIHLATFCGSGLEILGNANYHRC